MTEVVPQSSRQTGGVTLRAVLVSFVLLILVAVTAFYVEIAWRRVYEFGSGVPAMAPVALLFILTALMGIPTFRRVGFTRRELLTVYAIVLVGAPLVSHGVLFWMIPKTIAYYYSARVHPAWETAFLQHIPSWFSPTDFDAVEGFFEGHAQVPWSLWWIPMSSKVPTIPAIPLGPIPIVQWQKIGPLAGLGQIDLVLWPWMIALAYLIPKELSFSAWFFWLVRLGLTVAAIAYGHNPQRPEEWYESGFPAPYMQGGGAALALGFWVLWIARRHLIRAVGLAFGRSAGPADSRETLPYRWAMIGLVVSFSFMVYFCYLAGCRPAFGLIMVALIVGYYVMWARLRAETGLGFLPFPLEIQDGIVVPFGAGIFRPREIVTLISTRWAFFPGFGESFEVCTGNALESFKIADSAGINKRRLSIGILSGFLLALVVGVLIVLVGTYHYGWQQLGVGSTYSWTSWQTRNDGERIFQYLTNPGGTDVNGLLAIISGAVVAVFLGAMRLRFWWWPFHPVGYIAANCWGMQWYYMPFFLGWALKSLAIRYGGLRLYRQTVPLAIGLIVGNLLNGAVWSVVALLTKGRV